MGPENLQPLHLELPNPSPGVSDRERADGSLLHDGGEQLSPMRPAGRNLNDLAISDFVLAKPGHGRSRRRPIERLRRSGPSRGDLAEREGDAENALPLLAPVSYVLPSSAGYASYGESDSAAMGSY